MKASDVKLSELKTFEECEEAITSIELDYRNVEGGRKAFFSGEQTFLKKTAQDKINRIRARQDRLDT